MLRFLSYYRAEELRNCLKGDRVAVKLRQGYSKLVPTLSYRIRVGSVPSSFHIIKMLEVEDGLEVLETTTFFHYWIAFLVVVAESRFLYFFDV